MAGNPFYVDPSLDISQGLQGLNTGLAAYQNRKKEQEAKDNQKAILKGAVDVYRSGDPMAIAEYALQNPSVGEELTSAVKFRDQATKDNYINSAFRIFQNADNPEEVRKIAKGRQAFLKARGLPPEERKETDSFLERYEADPESTLAKLENEIAFLAPEKYEAYRKAKEVPAEKDTRTADIKNLEYYNKLKETDPALAEDFAKQVGISKEDKDTRTADIKNLDHYDKLLLTDPEKAEKFATQIGITKEVKDTRTVAVKNFEHYDSLSKIDPEKAKQFGDFTGIKRVTPYTDIAKLKTDLNNELITQEEYTEKRNKILNPTMKNKTELTMAAFVVILKPLLF